MKYEETIPNHTNTVAKLAFVNETQALQAMADVKEARVTNFVFFCKPNDAVIAGICDSYTTIEEILQSHDSKDWQEIANFLLQLAFWIDNAGPRTEKKGVLIDRERKLYNQGMSDDLHSVTSSI